MIPATIAVCSGSPFFTFPDRNRRNASAVIVISPVATASRVVTGLRPTSTIRTSPCGPTWVRRLAGTVISLSQKERKTLERDGQVHTLQLDVGRHFECAGRKVEYRFDARGDHLLDDWLRMHGWNGDHADIEAIAAGHLLELSDVVDGNAASRS